MVRIPSWGIREWVSRWVGSRLVMTILLGWSIQGVPWVVGMKHREPSAIATLEGCFGAMSRERRVIHRVDSIEPVKLVPTNIAGKCRRKERLSIGFPDTHIIGVQDPRTMEVSGETRRGKVWEVQVRSLSHVLAKDVSQR